MSAQKNISLSLPQLSVFDVDGEETTVSHDDFSETENTSLVISPLTPKLTPTIRAQNLSPFWLSGVNTSPLSQISGSTGDSPLDPTENISGGFSLLHAAAITGDNIGLEKLASGNFCDIDLLDKFGRTPLMYAVLGNYPECVDTLLKFGANPKLKDSSGRNSLHWTVHHNRHQCARILLSKAKLDWRTPDKGGVTVLHLAVRHAKKKVLQTLLKHFKISKREVDVCDANKRTPLHWAASNLRFEHARELIKLGASVGVLDVEGKTPIHWAVQSTSEDSVRLVELLLKCKPESAVNWQDYEGRIPLHIAVVHSSPDAVRSLVSSPSCRINALDNSLRSPLHLAALSGRPDICTLLLDCGAKYDILDEVGATPVHLSSLSGSRETVEVFLKRGLGEVLDMEKRTALMWAAARGILTVLPAFTNASLQAVDSSGYTALHIAVSCGLLASCSALCALGCNIGSCTNDGLTPLMLAAQLGFLQIAIVLLESGATVANLDVNGRTALHHASQAGHANLVSLILERGALVHQVDRYGRSALQMASFGGFLEIVMILLDAGSSINLQDNQGFCALHWAVRRGHLDVVKKLIKKNAFPNNIGFLEVDEEEVQVTPTDSALMGQQSEILSLLLENGGVRITRIFNIAATTIQAYWRGYRIRKSFYKRKELFVKHEKLKARRKRNKSRKKGSDEKQKQKKQNCVAASPSDVSENETVQENVQVSPRSRIRRVAGRFLGSVVEGHQRSSYLRRVPLGEDEPLPNQIPLSTVGDPSLNAVPLSTLLDPEARSESRFSYNLKQ